MITVESKDELIQCLLCEELLTKRIDGLDNLQEGLNYFGLVDLLKRAPNIGQDLFISRVSNYLSADHLMNYFQLHEPSKAEELTAFNHLLAFVREYENATGRSSNSK